MRHILRVEPIDPEHLPGPIHCQHPERLDLRLAADHHLDQFGSRQAVQHPGADVLPVTQHADPVADLVNLVELVRDEDDGHPSLF